MQVQVQMKVQVQVRVYTYFFHKCLYVFVGNILIQNQNLGRMLDC